MRFIYTFVIVHCVATFALAQSQEIVRLKPNDSTANMYYAICPDKQQQVKGLMFLLPGAFQTSANVLQQSTLPQYAATQGIITIIPLFEAGIQSFGIDSLSQQSLDSEVRHAVVKYGLQGKPLYMGGFSLGGSAAVKYAERAVQGTAPLKPTAVFAIDPPLDFERYYNAAKRIMRITTAGQVNQEVPYMLGRIEQETGGSPKTALENYRNLSPYSYTDESQRAVRLLTRMPIMFITEPDVDWWIAQRGYDYSFMNATDQAAMINELQKLGNTRAVLVTTQNKGFRKPDNTRHPHSFSIVDNAALIKWLTELN